MLHKCEFGYITNVNDRFTHWLIAFWLCGTDKKERDKLASECIGIKMNKSKIKLQQHKKDIVKFNSTLFKMHIRCLY